MRTLLHLGVWILAFCVASNVCVAGLYLSRYLDPEKGPLSLAVLVASLLLAGWLGACAYSWLYARLPAKRAPKQEVPWR